MKHKIILLIMAAVMCLYTFTACTEPIEQLPEDPPPTGPAEDTGRMNEQFENISGWSLVGEGQVRGENGLIVIKDNPGGDNWATVQKTYNGVNAAKYPYLKLDIASLSDTVCRLVVIIAKASAPNVHAYAGRFEYTGEYFIDLSLEYYSDVDRTLLKFDSESEDIVIKLSTEGAESTTKLDSLTGESGLPAASAATAYADEFDNVGSWLGSTGYLVVNDGTVAVFSQIKGSDNGRIINRIAFNSSVQPYLHIKADEFTVASLAVSAKHVSGAQVGNEVILMQIGEPGIYSVNVASVFGDSANLDLILFLTVYGTDGFEVTVDYIKGSAVPADVDVTGIVENFDSDSGWSGADAVTSVTDGVMKVTANGLELWGGGVAKTLSFATSGINYIGLRVTALGGGATHVVLKTGDEFYDINITAPARGVFSYELQDEHKASPVFSGLFFIIVVGSPTAYAELDFITVSETDPATGAEPGPLAPALSEQFNNISGWSGADANVSGTGGVMRVTVNGTQSWGGGVGKTYSFNTIGVLYVAVRITALGGGATQVTVKSGDGPYDISITAKKTGTHLYKLRQFQIDQQNITVPMKIIINGGTGAYAEIDFMITTDEDIRSS